VAREEAEREARAAAEARAEAEAAERAAAEAAAKAKAEADARAAAEAEAKRRAAEEAKARAEAEAAAAAEARRAAEEAEAKAKEEAEAKRRAEEVAAKAEAEARAQREAAARAKHDAEMRAKAAAELAQKEAERQEARRGLLYRRSQADLVREAMEESKEKGATMEEAAESTAPVPPPPPAKGGEVGDDKWAPFKTKPANVRGVVESFYRYYNPDKLLDPAFLPSVLSTYRGHEAILVRQLTSLYGPEPHELWLQVKSGKGFEAFNSPGGTTRKRTEKSDTSVGASTPTTAKEMRRRIEKFYRHYNPEKLKDAGFLETVIGTYKGHEGILIRQLIALYGPEPKD
jgi:hypothetical protein